MDAPEFIDGAKVILFTAIDQRHRHTDNCRHVVTDVPQGPAAGLAICQYESEEGYYLLGCDARWSSGTDTWHQTVEEARRQAEFEYEGTMGAWQCHA